ncbi:MAG: class II glutamine amidotransferase [Erysipelotrichaceae bacterium]|nr:class II glutamine amidotransferase [Erysipelotrichaceae bacterium]
MCELFAASLNQPLLLNNYLKEFYTHSPNHPHGWGLACISGSLVNIEKEPIMAIDSDYLTQRLEVPISSPVVLAHIRYATMGTMEYVNTHPYTLNDYKNNAWTLIHNGTIFKYSALDSYIHIQKGSTDSERILYYLIDQMNQSYTEGNDLFYFFDKIITDMSKGNKLNVIFSDGSYVYVHTNYDSSLYYLKKEEGTLFATVPLSDENWQKVPMNCLLVYDKGQLIYEGNNHHHTYYDNQQDLNQIYQTYSNL